MDMPQGNSLFGYLKQKYHFFCKIRKREGGTGPAWWGEVSTPVQGEGMRKGCKRVNMVQMLCMCECKQKKDTCCNYVSNGWGGGDKVERRGLIQV
jgi:hypothetical protein